MAYLQGTFYSSQEKANMFEVRKWVKPGVRFCDADVVCYQVSK